MKRSRTFVLAALAVVVLLGGGLWYRLHTRDTDGRYPWPATPPLTRLGTPAPAANVPSPRVVARLELPLWGGPDRNADASVRFRTDLDVLAPLGDGPANAALWLKDFTKGAAASRTEEAERAMKQRVDGPADLGKVLPADAPLLLEAEAWADQATLRFYPDIFPVRGQATPIPNLLLSLTFSKSWLARALANPDAPTALEDCRRAIRWGRLLRQDDVTIIQDLIGLACIRMGAKTLYDVAARRGDTATMLAAAIVNGEHGPQRLVTMERLNHLALFPGENLGVSAEKLDAMAEMARSCPDRRFRFEAILKLAVVRAKGARAHRAKAQEILDGLAGEKDPILLPLVHWARVSTFKKEELAGLIGPW